MRWLCNILFGIIFKALWNYWIFEISFWWNWNLSSIPAFLCKSIKWFVFLFFHIISDNQFYKSQIFRWHGFNRFFASKNAENKIAFIIEFIAIMLFNILMFRTINTSIDWRPPLKGSTCERILPPLITKIFLQNYRFLLEKY